MPPPMRDRQALRYVAAPQSGPVTSDNQGSPRPHARRPAPTPQGHQAQPQPQPQNLSTPPNAYSVHGGVGSTGDARPAMSPMHAPVPTIGPGPHAPGVRAQGSPPSAREKTGPGALVGSMIGLIGGVLVGVIGTLLVIGVLSVGNSPSALIETALEDCGMQQSAWVERGDDGTTLTMKAAGSSSPGANFNDVSCVLTALGAPDSVAARMGQTRALDGTQTASWDDFTATWTYHPDAGLNVILDSSTS